MLKINNKTRYRTQDIRAIVARVAQDELDREHRRRFQFLTVTYARGQRMTGWATYSGRSMCVRLPRPEHYVINRVALAWLIGHEMAHLRGMTHLQMSGSARYYQIGRWREIYAWAAEMPLRVDLPKRKSTTRPGPEEKLAHVQQLLKGWQAKAKKAATYIKKYQAKARYYQRAVDGQTAAATTPKPNQEN